MSSTLITSAITLEELLRHLVAISSKSKLAPHVGAIPSSVIALLEAIPDKKTLNTILDLSILSCMSVKAVMDPIVAASGVKPGPQWKVGDTMNFSVYATTGHMLFMLPDRSMSSKLRKAQPFYKKFLGGSRDLTEFGTSGIVDVKPERTKVLRQEANRIHNPPLRDLVRAISGRAPEFVRPGLMDRGIGELFSSLITALFLSLFRIGELFSSLITALFLFLFRLVHAFLFGSTIRTAVLLALIMTLFLSPFRIVYAFLLRSTIRTAVTFALVSLAYYNPNTRSRIIRAGSTVPPAIWRRIPSDFTGPVDAVVMEMGKIFGYGL